MAAEKAAATVCFPAKRWGTLCKPSNTSFTARDTWPTGCGGGDGMQPALFKYLTLGKQVIPGR